MEGEDEMNKSDAIEAKSDDKKLEVVNKNSDSLPVRSYLDQTVVPILIQALSELAKERL